MIEQAFVVDADDNPCTPAGRQDVIASGTWRRASGGVLVDRQRLLVLCHQRSPIKDERPDLWVATFGGKNRPGEEAAEAAMRELFEEFGVDVTSVDTKFFGRYKAAERQQFEYLFHVFADAVSTTIVPDIAEVARVEWLPISAAIHKLRSSPAWYNYGYEEQLLRKVED